MDKLVPVGFTYTRALLEAAVRTRLTTMHTEPEKFVNAFAKAAEADFTRIWNML